MRRTLAIRVLFLCLILILPIELVVLRVAGSEPYPAVFMPNFGGVPEKNGAVTVTVTKIEGFTSVGKSIDIDPTAIIPNTTKLAESISGDFFSNEHHVQTAAADGWFADRLAEMYPDETFAKVRVTRTTDYVAPDTRKLIKRTVLQDYTFAVTKGLAP